MTHSLRLASAIALLSAAAAVSPAQVPANSRHTRRSTQRR